MKYSKRALRHFINDNIELTIEYADFIQDGPFGYREKLLGYSNK